MNELLIVDKQLTPEEKPSIKREMEIIEDDSFNYDGYQVVRGEFFSHLYEPCITFNNFKVYMNTACIKKLPETDYVQILVNQEKKKLAVRPCSEFGVPVEEHQKSLQIDIFDGYALFGMNDKSTKNNMESEDMTHE